MDKKTLLLLVFLFLPGIAMLLTLFSPEFNLALNVDWYSSFTARVCFSIFCNSVAVTSLLILIFNKDLPMDKLYDMRVEKRKVLLTNTILKYLEENNINTQSEEHIRKFVDDNFDTNLN